MRVYDKIFAVFSKTLQQLATISKNRSINYDMTTSTVVILISGPSFMEDKTFYK